MSYDSEARHGSEQEPLTEWEADFRDWMCNDGITSSQRQSEILRAMEKAIVDRAIEEGLIPPDNQQ